MRYMAANLAEGLQESYQESISKAMTDYYVNSLLVGPIDQLLHHGLRRQVAG
jgi:hypothetical protein